MRVIAPHTQVVTNRYFSSSEQMSKKCASSSPLYNYMEAESTVDPIELGWQAIVQDDRHS